MTPSLFSTIGYISIGLWTMVPILWILHHRRRPRRWLCHVAALLAVAAFVCAKVNSNTYVNRIQLDRSDEIAAAQARHEQARQTALAAREGSVADIRFAEDNADDHDDHAGMDESERKYYEKLKEGAEPAWKKEKKQRGDGKPDGSLESLVGANDTADGMNVKAIEEHNGPPPVVMAEARLALANRLDAANLAVSRWLLWLALLLIVLDYLARFNRPGESYLPLPIPAAWAEALTPLPPVVERPWGHHGDCQQELAAIVRRGDVFLFLTDDPAAAAALAPALRRYPIGGGTVDVLRVNDTAVPIDDDFIFESLWFGRACFVVDDAAGAGPIFNRLIARLDERRSTRARVCQPVHVVWNLKTPLSEEQRRRFSRAARATGFSLLTDAASSTV